MSEQQRTLHADVPHEAAEILAMAIAKMVPQGMTGQEIAVTFEALGTVRRALAPPAPVAAKAGKK